MSPDKLVDTGTLLHPAVVGLIIASFLFIPLINVRYAIFIMVFFSILIPKTQRISILTLNFNIIRLILLAGWIKIMFGMFFSKKYKLEKFEKIDKLIILYVMVSFVAYILQQPNINAVIHMLGFTYDIIGTYFLYRIIIKRNADINSIINSLAIITVIVAFFMFWEQLTGKNWFYVLGARDEFTFFRLGRLRSSGPFGHPITAGLFGAMMLPLCFSMWRNKCGSPLLGLAGMLSACVIVMTSSSMTSLVAGVSAIIALLFWQLRNRMRIVNYCVVFTAIMLQIIMISPIWSFIRKMDFIKGASTEHRFMLVDNLINHFNEWFLIGADYNTYYRWGFGMVDAANQYYAEGITGGLLKIALFILIIVYVFKIIGRKIKIIKYTSSQKILWAMGASLFSIAVGFLGISMWDQMLFLYWMFLALIISRCLINDEGYLIDDKLEKKLAEGQSVLARHHMRALG